MTATAQTTSWTADNGNGTFTNTLFYDEFSDPDIRYANEAFTTREYLSTVALQKDGRVGYVQPIGERAIPGQTVDANSQANFGVGAFLLAACEYCRYLRR